HLGKHFAVYGIQAQGLLQGQEIISDANALVKAYADLVESISMDRDIYLAGQSIGGVFALALADELERREKRVVMLALFDSFVPNEKNLEQIGLNHLQAALGAFIQVDKQALQDLSELEQLQILFEQARDAYLIPQDIEFS